MRIAMINDCAFVGETLAKYLSKEFEVVHIKRSRRFFDKTFGIAWRVLRVEGSLYHVHYLLQDCYLALKFGKCPLVGHAHGSDLRATLNHPLWGRIVRYNLKNCDKVIVSTPDILSIAGKFREDTEYLPNPVDTELFYPKPFINHKGKKRVLIASDSNWAVKGTDMAIRALSKIKNEVDVSIIAYGKDFERTLALASSIGLKLNVLPKIPHDRLNEHYWSIDVVIDRFKSGSLGMVSLEAIACGRPVVTYVSSEYSEYKNFPLKDVDVEEKIADAIGNANTDLWREEYTYLKENHDPQKITNQVKKIYEEVLCPL